MIEDEMTIGLYGIAGVYNYGCEAIIRGTEAIIRKKWPDIHIKYASLRPEDDKKRLEGCNVEIVPRKLFPRSTIPGINRMLATTTGLYFKTPYREDISWLKDCDIIFSIGGDLYTLYSQYKDPKIKRYYNPLIHFGDIVISKGIPFVIWGASVGPFEGWPTAKKHFIKHLQEVNLITSREHITTNYLKDNGVNNVIQCADPAYMVPSPKIKEDDKEKITIGINLSPLSSHYTFQPQEKNKNIEKQAKIIESLIKKFNANIILIPHVVCDFDENDDDLRYLKHVKSKISENFKNDVVLITDDIGFVKTKEVLSKCDIVIAARMHCAINSISIGVPTIFLSYSSKAIGMSEFVYGNKDFVIPLNEFMNLDKTFKLVEFILENDFNKFINKRMIDIKNESYLPLDYIEKLFI